MTPSQKQRERSDEEHESPVQVTSVIESIVGCKWSVRLLQLCAEGQTRPSAFLRACPGLSTKVMNERWRKMVRFGIVQRSVFGEKPPIEVNYSLKHFGWQFLKILEDIRSLQQAVDGYKESNREAAPDHACSPTP